MVDLSTLFNAAKRVHQLAYAPYSNFKVGTALQTDSGEIFTGCNVENAAYPIGTFAEAGAIAAMIAAGRKHITHIMIIGTGTKPCFPCGACRQRIAEFGDAQTQIYVGSTTGYLPKAFTIAELLPHSFELT